MNAGLTRVLHRNEAAQMVTDLAFAIERIIMIAADADDPTKVCALDTAVLLQTKKNIIESEIAWADREAAERDLATLRRAAAERGGAP